MGSHLGLAASSSIYLFGCFFCRGSAAARQADTFCQHTSIQGEGGQNELIQFKIKEKSYKVSSGGTLKEKLRV